MAELDPAQSELATRFQQSAGCIRRWKEGMLLDDRRGSGMALRRWWMEEDGDQGQGREAEDSKGESGEQESWKEGIESEQFQWGRRDVVFNYVHDG